MLDIFANKRPVNGEIGATNRIGIPEILSPGSRILLVSDGADGNWLQEHGRKPLINGVNTFSEKLTSMLQEKGYKVDFTHPFSTEPGMDRRIFRTGPMPFYRTVEMVTNNPLYVNRQVMELLDKKPDGVFIATVEGFLGLTTMLACRRLGIPYTLASTTNFAEYASTYVAKSTHNIVRPSPNIFQAVINLLYRKASHILVPTATMQKRFEQMGFEGTTIWQRGVDTTLFRPSREGDVNPYEQFEWYRDNPLPILLSVGRVGADKNLPHFLDMTDEEIMPATGQKFHKVIIGDGPQFDEYKTKYKNPTVHFLGSYSHDEVSPFFRFARLFVFPSTKDAFGNVIVEAGASGTPVLAYSGNDGSYPIGSQDCVLDGENGVKIPYGEPLISGLPRALQIDRNTVHQSTVENFSWDKTFQIFLEHIVPIDWNNVRRSRGGRARN